MYIEIADLDPGAERNNVITGWAHDHIPTDRVHVQVLLVAGGWDAGNNRLASTETLVILAGAWRTVGPMPTALTGLRGATLDNRIYMTGEWSHIFIVSYCAVMFQEDGMATEMTPSSSTTRRRRGGAQLAR